MAHHTPIRSHVSSEPALYCAALAVGSAGGRIGIEASCRAQLNVDFDGGTQKTYQRMIEDLDLQVGRVVEAIRANGIAENTIVIFTSDNGGERFADTWPFTGRKTELLEGGSGFQRSSRGRHADSEGTNHQPGGNQHGLAADAAGGGRRF